MKFDEFHRLVRANGWIKLRQLGTSHVIYKKGRRTYPVPYHRGKEMGRGLEMKIRKEMGLK
ncbi:MAG: type II toxin-antitoxin system HicA family toxin [Bacteroidales bacterium]|nr:type II toxin-antitoxin system HicA family toxin [Bacteroidales bacterium]